MSYYTLDIEDLRAIYTRDGAGHAKFCIDQMEVQDGSEATAPLRAELARLIAAEAKA